MIATIARKEFVEMTRDGRFRLSAVVVALLLAAALLTGWRHWRDVSAQHAAATRVTREHWLQQPAKNPHSAAHYGVYAFKPKPPLAFADRGVDGYVGTYTWLEAHRQNEYRGRPAQDATPAARFGEWTAAAVLQLLIPLLIVMLAFPAFAGERDRGTLRQLASLGVPPARLAAGKALGVGGALALLLVPAALAGALALVLAGGDGAVGARLGDTLARIAALAVGYLAYFSAFLAVALAVSTRARTARAALVALIAFWAVNALAAPRVAAAVARAAAPTPTALAFSVGLERAMSSDPHGLSSEQRAAQFRDSVLAAYGVVSVDHLPVNFAGLALDEGERHGDRVFDAQYGALYDRWRTQERVRSAVAVASPLLAVRALSMGLAGTDFEQHRHFQAAAERYRRDLMHRMNRAMAERGRTADGSAPNADATLWASVPPFAYEMPGAGWVLARQGANVAVLAGWRWSPCSRPRGPRVACRSTGEGRHERTHPADRVEGPRPPRTGTFGLARGPHRRPLRPAAAGGGARRVGRARGPRRRGRGGGPLGTRMGHGTGGHRRAGARRRRRRLDSLRATLAARANDTTPLAPFGDPRSPYAAGTTLARRWAVLPTLPLGPIATGRATCSRRTRASRSSRARRSTRPRSWRTRPTCSPAASTSRS
jgi:ABC-2 type transport system permease protein